MGNITKQHNLTGVMGKVTKCILESYETVSLFFMHLQNPTLLFGTESHILAVKKLLKTNLMGC